MTLLTRLRTMTAVIWSLVIKVKKDFALSFRLTIKYNFNYIIIVALKTHPEKQNDHLTR